MDLRIQPASGPTVVVIEDDLAVLNALAFALDAEGFHVRLFETANEVWHAEGLNEAQCLVIDQMLPDEPGLNLLTRLRRRGVFTPAVLITTNPTAALRLQAGGLDVPVVEKPLLGDQLFDQIRTLSATTPDRQRGTIARSVSPLTGKS